MWKKLQKCGEKYQGKEELLKWRENNKGWNKVAGMGHRAIILLHLSI